MKSENKADQNAIQDPRGNVNRTRPVSMAKHLLRLSMVGALLAASGGAHAQLMDALKSQLPGNNRGTTDQSGQSGQSGQGGIGGAIGSLGGMGGGVGGIGGAGPAVSAGSVSNVAGVLQFCVKNNYLSGGGVSAIKDKLMSRVPGNQPTQDPGYKNGVAGILTGSNGEKMSLSGGGIKDKITKKVCEKILQQGKSLL